MKDIARRRKLDAMTVAIFDYGTGNLHTLVKAFENSGAQVAVETDVEAALRFNALVLPGVGVYQAAASRLVPFAPAVRAALASGHPCLGISLGMHLLFEISEEGDGAGVAALRGRVRKLNARRLPHVGWNDVTPTNDDLFAGVPSFLGWYTNSFVAEPSEGTTVLGWSQYEADSFPAAVRRDRTWGVQFQPEKSGAPGLRLISNFVRAASE
jgi:imidazole glycerol-phosphate synthase subunit HisH